MKQLEQVPWFENNIFRISDPLAAV
jgi:hypothetical protein